MSRLPFSMALMVFLTMPLYGQGPDTSNSYLLRTYFEKAKTRQSFYLSADQIGQFQFENLLQACISYLNDPDPFIRYKSIDLIKRAGSLSEKPEDRQRAVLFLIHACKDVDSGNSGVASSGLLSFHSEDFTQQASDSLVVLLRNRCFNFERIIRICGFVENSSILEALNSLQLNDTTLNAREKWGVNLALARSGNMENLKYCIDKIKSAAINNNFISYLVPDLIYIRQPASVDIILQEILSDEKRCTSSNPDNEIEIICAFRLIEQIAPIIKNFPVHLSVDGSLDSDNLDESLLLARKWITLKQPYELIRNIY